MTPTQLTWQFVIFKDIHWEFEEMDQLVVILHSLISNGSEMMDVIYHNQRIISPFFLSLLICPSSILF